MTDPDSNLRFLPTALEELKRLERAVMLRKVIKYLIEIQGQYDPEFDNLISLIELKFKDEV